MENEKRISRAKRGSAWGSVSSWVTLAMRLSDAVDSSNGTTGIRLVRDQSQDHFTHRLVSEEKVMMCGTMIGEGPESVRAIQRYPRDKDSPRQLTGIRLTADIK